MGLVGVFSSQVPSTPSMEESYSTTGVYGLDVVYDPDFASVEYVLLGSDAINSMDARSNPPFNGPSPRLI